MFAKTGKLENSLFPLSPGNHKVAFAAAAAAIDAGAGGPMTPRAVSSHHHRHGQAMESCMLQLHSWKPFQIDSPRGGPIPNYPKKPCLSNRSTAPDLDLSRLSILDESSPRRRRPPPIASATAAAYRLNPSKRRRNLSRSVSGRSSDRSATTCRPACSDFPLAAGGTDSGGELWGSDASEARVPRREGREAGIVIDRESSGSGMNQGVGAASGAPELQGNESGYGSEPGYRGDGELGYDDGFDEEEDDGRMLFWNARVGDLCRFEMRARLISQG